MDSFSHPNRSKNGGGVIQGRPVGSLLSDRVNPFDSHRRSTRFGQCMWEDNPQHTLEEIKTKKKEGKKKRLSHSQNTTGKNQTKKTTQLQACSTFHEKAKMTPRVVLEPREQSLRTQKIIPRLGFFFFPVGFQMCRDPWLLLSFNFPLLWMRMSIIVFLYLAQYSIQGADNFFSRSHVHRWKK